MIKTLLDQFKLPLVLVLLGLIAGLALFHFARVGMLQHDLTTAQKRIGELTIENATLTAANNTMASHIDAQNKQIEKLIKEAEERARQAEKDMAHIRMQAEKWRKRYNEILNSPMPTGDECKAANDILSRYRGVREEEKGESK